MEILSAPPGGPIDSTVDFPVDFSPWISLWVFLWIFFHGGCGFYICHFSWARGFVRDCFVHAPVGGPAGLEKRSSGFRCGFCCDLFLYWFPSFEY